ncbi:autotransporter assembly complex family protein [Sphingorhabdus sp.]|uniref:autotransporter assembly complex family protein n=1 Tax=Sphingorhabdus sp. TaxID=1902408 RepID=UPI0037C61F2A
MIRLTAFLYLGCAAAPLLAQNPATGAVVPAQGQSTMPAKILSPAPADPQTPIIGEEEFDAAIPSLDDAPLESIDAWQAEQEAKEEGGTAPQQAAQTAADPAIAAVQDGDVEKILPDPPVTDPLLDDPLPPIDSFDAEPPPEPTQAAEREARALRYIVRIDGLDATKTTDVAKDADGVAVEAAIWRDVRARFDSLSVLNDGDGTAENRAEISQRARADRQLLLDILNGQGFFDADVRVAVQPSVLEGQPLDVILTVVPGRRYYLGQIAFAAPAVQPVDLISRSFVAKGGDPIVADIILAAEANISVELPQNGYPFAKVGERDILLDSDRGVGDYSLPVETGARSYFGQLRTEGSTAFDADHVSILRRFKTGDLYDSRKVDDLRAALIATGLLSTVSVEPVPGEGSAPDGTPYADLLVRQEAAPPRTIAGSAGYGTGQGLRADASWTHRNLFPPEGSLTAAGVVGTKEQAASISVARANAGRRDRNIDISLTALHSNYDAFEAYTGRLAGTMSFVSTPIWQKKFTWSIGAEILATSEDQFDFARGLRDRQTFYVAALPGQVGFDRSDNLLDPTKGYRVNVRVSPETSLGTGKQIYVRAILDASYYYPVKDNIVVAARGRVGTISGIARDNLAPSRRFYGGGGGSVRGFGYQQLGPKDPNNDPVGGRSMNEFSLEGRYRFGNYGVVGFVDAGQAYESSIPKFKDWRMGVGVGGRFYTNFGPIRLDIATPVNRRLGESRVSVYVSIGQAF